MKIRSASETVSMQPVDLRQIRTVPRDLRTNKVMTERFARPPRAGLTVAEFVAGMPGMLACDDFRDVVRSIVTARRAGRPCVAGLGGHVVKCGLTPVLIDLMQRGILTALAMNGAAAIHDFEVARIGATSEDVLAGLKDGTFGMAGETGMEMNQAILRVLEQPDLGMGAVLADMLMEVKSPYQDVSLLVAARRLRLPVTVHVAIGADIIHMHPMADGAALGQASFNDFRLFAAQVADLSGGVYLNLGSAVMLPEVFLKAFALAQNLGANLHDFVTVDMDMTSHYRPNENVVRRPAAVGGRGYTLLGRHEIMIPLLAQAIVDAMAMP